MPHNVHPYAHRIGILRDWRSRWFGMKGQYVNFLKCDVLIREFLQKRLRGLLVSGVEIERGRKSLRIVIKTARPGMLIGKSGEGAVKLKNEIISFLKKFDLIGQEELKLDVEEVKSPEGHAAIVAQMIAESLEKRMPFRRVMKQTLEKVMANRDIKGVKVYLGGRLGGAEIARSEEMKKGRVPLQTFRADIDFARERAHMTYGDIGIKVWIYKGEIFAANQGAKRP
ncbi:MAG: 30S ribosomal protein S3 [Candidatus Taylorbacteria bacterium RIFCSPLOWO2_02_FULL_43_11]|uniref:Small ribosomal subunit protein uS3 n=1 Tax=Candidatus Taylorbacteria bacterium RIFCSPHIGHO2_02_FULL_43_32b TaxID=1802306 RepID=A0A1G2MHA6_9BACT|nr:MAG: 30S ribosomal protein S3 [Candidatus Taylorbacteria bacterium RIFCSPHIGHO2_01_FULL_43_47]OHA23296.1 MAG: 30S ribosomal protein S3 [Candidatus Taylorbacteria bacterium RIFCSPHIGHO2_02_FULL_43_32b]OHA30164.1 MAG: 30S ribosomal protein S3 [Candidatus Taylorbacteria bacterium RIFCSPLOWO2_01_FULL_43_44]OHA36027.1 MAG: 30S ribosomal protein S3 [Candidatus Taylorbacteria bacterium RIFCSPLOWO2_02_FULL_43_11]